MEYIGTSIHELNRSNNMENIENKNINNLISSINNLIKTQNQPKKENNEIPQTSNSSDKGEIIKTKRIKVNNIKNNKNNNKIYILKEIGILTLIYLLLSIDGIKNIFGTFIKSINTDEQGNISFIGVIIYGIILSILFILTRYYFLDEN
jgi:hypothetical protein